MKTQDNDSQILKERIIEIQQIMEDLEKRVKKIHHYILWSKIFTFFKILIFVVLPLLLYLHFLPQIKKWIDSYKNLLKIQDTIKADFNLLPQLQKMPDDLMPNKDHEEYLKIYDNIESFPKKEIKGSN